MPSARLHRDWASEETESSLQGVLGPDPTLPIGGHWRTRMGHCRAWAPWTASWIPMTAWCKADLLDLFKAHATNAAR